VVVALVCVAAAMACGEAPGFGWSSSLVNNADEHYLVRYVHDGGRIVAVVDPPAGAAGLGLFDPWYEGKLEVLTVDCEVVSEMQLLIEADTTAVDARGVPRRIAREDLPDDARFDELVQLGDTCGSPPIFPSPSR
jgi:hypothetical protein